MSRPLPKQVDVTRNPAAGKGYGLTPLRKIPQELVFHTQEFFLDGLGVELTTGVAGYIPIEYPITITGWSLVGDTTGSIQIDLWKTSNGTVPTITGTITGSNPPLISSGVYATGTTKTWMRQLKTGDILAVNVDSVTSFTKATLTLRFKG